MRYDSLGDFFRNGAGTDRIEIQDIGNTTYEICIAIHEFVEMMLCKTRGITYDQVDEWDIDTFKGDGEPGDDPLCPYHKEHVFASKIERMMCEELGCDWQVYLSFTDSFNPKENEHETK